MEYLSGAFSRREAQLSPLDNILGNVVGDDFVERY
jgi:hypothetical protein